jgi:hypothetical protein
MTKRISMFTEDTDPRYDGRAHDTVLNAGGPVITTKMRINSEPADKIPPGFFGALLDGSSGRPINADQLAAQLTTAFDLLPPAELAKLKKILAKYGSSSGMTQLGQSNFDDAPDALTMGQGDAVAAINSANADFWAKRAAAERL